MRPMTRRALLLAGAVVLALPLIASAQQNAGQPNTDGYSPAARRMFNMVADCPAGGTKNLSDEARLRERTQLRETGRDGQIKDSKTESIYDLQRTTENRCK